MLSRHRTENSAGWSGSGGAHAGEGGRVTERERETDMGESQESPTMICLSVSLCGVRVSAQGALQFQRRFSTFSRRTAPLRELFFFSPRT